MKAEVTNIPPAFDRYRRPADLLEACKDRPLASYPLPEDRWHLSAEAWESMAETGVITVPDGPWMIASHPDREKAAAEGRALDPADPADIDVATKTAWRNEYHLVTDRGLPVHPMAKLGTTAEVLDEQTGALLKTGYGNGNWTGMAIWGIEDGRPSSCTARARG